MGPGNHNTRKGNKKLLLPVTERELTLLSVAVTMKYHSSMLDEYRELKKYLELQKKILTEVKKPRI
jgi:hypothetical protein